jgi:hypothetical protein
MVDVPDHEKVPPLLEAIELDESVRSPNREQIRAEILATFDAATSDDGASADASGGSAASAEIVAISAREQPRRASAGRLVAWAAAAILIAGVGLALVEGRSPYRTAEPSQQTEAEDVKSLVGHGIELPAPLEDGRQATNAISSGIAFDAPPGFFVLEESPGLIVLADAEISTHQTGRIVIVELQPVDLEAELRSLGEAGMIDIEKVDASGAGPTQKRWEVTIRSDAARELGCLAGDPCLHLPGQSTDETALLWAGAENRITQLDRSPSLVVAAVEQSLRLSGPFSRRSSQLVDSVELIPD